MGKKIFNVCFLLLLCLTLHHSLQFSPDRWRTRRHASITHTRTLTSDYRPWRLRSSSPNSVEEEDADTPPVVMFDDFAREDLPDPLLKALEVQEKLGRKVSEMDR